MNTTDNPQQLIDAAKAGNIHKLQEILPGAYAREKNKALVEAAKKGHTECVKILLTQCKNERENQRALLNAFRNGHTQCVELLLPYYPGPVEEDHWLLMDAVNEGHVDMVRILTQVSQQKTINAALMAAAIGGHCECAQALAAKASRATTSEALSRAALYGYLQIVEMFIPLSDPKSNNSQALRYAVVGKQTQCVEVLLSVSDTQKVLAHFQQTFSSTPDEWMFFAEMVERRSQRIMLNDITKEQVDANTVHRSRKM